MADRVSTSELLTPEDVAGRLGMSRHTIYKYLGRGDIPNFRLGYSYFIPVLLFNKMLRGEWKRDAD